MTSNDSELDGVRRDLDVAAEQKAVLGEAAELRWAAGEEAVLATVLAEAPGRRRPAWPRRVLGGLAAAAAALVLIQVLDREDGADDRRGEQLLGNELPDARPKGPGADYDRFAWALESRPGWRFELVVYDEELNVLAAPPPIQGSEWTPPAGTTEAWPDAILWTVAELPPAGVALPPYTVRAQRSSP